jgi:hypothetical protein
VDFVVCVGDRIHFWVDRWCGDHPLKEVFPDLYACASNQHATIASLLIQSASGSQSDWNVTFVRNFNDREMEGVVSSSSSFFIPILLSKQVAMVYVGD